MWIILAMMSAVFASLTSILAKVGIDSCSSHLATAIRTAVALIMSILMVVVTNSHHEILHISAKSWIFLILSGICTGASWLCYYHALKIGSVSKVAPIDKLSVVITILLAFILLGEQITPKSIIGCLLIGLGTLCMVM